MRSGLVCAMLGAGALLLTAGTAQAAPATFSQQFQGRGPGAYSFTTDSQGGSVQFWFATGTTHIAGQPAEAFNRVAFSHLTYECDNGLPYPDGTNSCRQTDRELDLYPAPDGAFSIKPNLSSATLPPTTGTLTTHECDVDPEFNYTNCTEDVAQVPVSATFTATGPLDVHPMHYQTNSFCHNVHAGSTRSRLATATFSVGDETFTTQGGPDGMVNLSEGTSVSVSRC